MEKSVLRRTLPDLGIAGTSIAGCSSIGIDSRWLGIWESSNHEAYQRAAILPSESGFADAKGNLKSWCFTDLHPAVGQSDSTTYGDHGARCVAETTHGANNFHGFVDEYSMFDSKAACTLLLNVLCQLCLSAVRIIIWQEPALAKFA